MVFGATGYIGKFVVKELVKRGYNVVAFAREKSGIGGKQSAQDVQKVRRAPSLDKAGLQQTPWLIVRLHAATGQMSLSWPEPARC